MSWHWPVAAAVAVGLTGATAAVGAPVRASAPGANGSGPAIAAADTGEMIATWLEGASGNTTVKASARAVGVAEWPASVTLGSGKAASVVVNPAGQALSGWMSNTAPYTVSASVRDTAGVWGAPDTFTTGEQNAPNLRIALQDDGTAHAAWSSSAGSGAVNAVQRSTGAAWTTPVDLAGGQGVDPSEMVFKVNGRGDGLAAWYTRNGSTDLIRATLRAAGGAWSAPVVVSSAQRSSDNALTGAIDAQGVPTLAWLEGNGQGNLVVSTRTSGAWATPVTVASGSSGVIRNPALAVNAAGRAVIGWSMQPPGQARTPWVAVRDDAGTWGTAVAVGSAADSLSGPRVVIDDAGVVTAGFAAGASATTQTAKVATRTAAGVWGTPVDVGNQGAVAAPALALDAAGTVLSAWTQGAAGATDVYTDGAATALESLSDKAAPGAGGAECRRRRGRMKAPTLTMVRRTDTGVTISWTKVGCAKRYLLLVRFADGKGVRSILTTRTHVSVRAKYQLGVMGKLRFSVRGINYQGHRGLGARRRMPARH